MSDAAKKNKEIELTNINNNLKMDNIDVQIENLLDDIYFFEFEYDYWVQILDKLYDRHNRFVIKNKQNPNLIMCEKIVAMEKNILLCEKSFIQTIGNLSKTKLNFELAIQKYYD
jgi:hypothetical protein